MVMEVRGAEEESLETGMDGKCQETRVPSLSRKIPWRRGWHPTPALLPGGPHGHRSLAGYVCGITKSRTRLSDSHVLQEVSHVIKAQIDSDPLFHKHQCSE